MSFRRVAMLSLHTSPLAQPGTGDGGGMNVYVRSLASALVDAGVECDVITRAEHPGQQPVVVVRPGFRVLHAGAGPLAPVSKSALVGLVPDLARAVQIQMAATGYEYDAIHANYWISGAVGHLLKHKLDIPLVATFHTLARVKAEAGVDDDPEDRTRVEAEVVRCADMVVGATADEGAALISGYGADPELIEVVPPGVDHGIFSPGDPAGARHRLGLPIDRRMLMFVGRIQPLKGVDLALRCLAELPGTQTDLVVVGGPSGPDGPAEVAHLHALAAELGITHRVRWVEPQPHEHLADYYRAADVCLVPSRSESFGLVALEAAACGTPVVASKVGGLPSLVKHGETGFLVDGRNADAYAQYVARLLGDDSLVCQLGVRAVVRSRHYTWTMTAARLRRLYADVSARALVRCQ